MAIRAALIDALDLRWCGTGRGPVANAIMFACRSLLNRCGTEDVERLDAGDIPGWIGYEEFAEAYARPLAVKAPQRHALDAHKIKYDSSRGCDEFGIIAAPDIRAGVGEFEKQSGSTLTWKYKKQFHKKMLWAMWRCLSAEERHDWALKAKDKRAVTSLIPIDAPVPDPPPPATPKKTSGNGARRAEGHDHGDDD